MVLVNEDLGLEALERRLALVAEAVLHGLEPLKELLTPLGRSRGGGLGALLVDGRGAESGCQREVVVRLLRDVGLGDVEAHGEVGDVPEVVEVLLLEGELLSLEDLDLLDQPVADGVEGVEDEDVVVDRGGRLLEGRLAQVRVGEELGGGGGAARRGGAAPARCGRDTRGLTTTDGLALADGAARTVAFQVEWKVALAEEELRVAAVGRREELVSLDRDVRCGTGACSSSSSSRSTVRVRRDVGPERPCADSRVGGGARARVRARRGSRGWGSRSVLGLGRQAGERVWCWRQ